MMASVFFFNDTATTEIYTLSLHDALPICVDQPEEYFGHFLLGEAGVTRPLEQPGDTRLDRKSTRLNSSHSQISYAVFCLKKKTSCQAIIMIWSKRRRGMVQRISIQKEVMS